MQALPGFRDFLPSDCAVRNYIFAIWREVSRRYGFVEYDGPLLEDLELFKKKSGEEIVKQLYDFTDKGGRAVALRPEMTPTLARMVAASHRDFRKPMKWFCLPQMFRYERPQRGRLREHYQYNCDIIGEAALDADVELISVCIDLLRAFGFTADDVVIRISDREFWIDFLRTHNVPEDQWQRVLELIDKSEREPREKTTERLGDLAPSVFEILDGGGRSEKLERLVSGLKARGLADFAKVDLGIVRGLAYYTGVVFEAFDRGGKLRAIAGGGRYDNLVAQLSDGAVSLPALGFAMGDVVLGELIRENTVASTKMQSILEANRQLDVFVVIAKEERRADALAQVQALRDQGYRVDYPLTPAKVGKQFQTAEHLNAIVAVLFGDEWPQVKVKELASRTEELVPHEELLAHLDASPQFVLPLTIDQMYRTHHCNQLRASDIGTTAKLAGWVHVRRDHGGVIFIDLRDREGLTQVVFRPEENAELTEIAHTLRHEDVIEVEGKVAPRVPGTENPKLETGAIELLPQQMRILNRADVLPFPLDSDPSNEDLRLSYRYFDLRRPSIARNLRVRHRVTKATRDYLDEQGFVEIETPILSKSTPEGARDFLVPSRLMPGKFYALPQAPQQYKQLLMVGGIEKYFQIAKCFRDEDLRADRQPEFTQIDIEASFVEPNDIFNLIEGMLANIFRASRGVEIPRPFERLTYAEALDQFGSDKPDRRFGLRLTDLRDIFAGSSFKMFRGALDANGAVKAINAKGFAWITTGQIDELTAMAKLYGAKGLAFIKVENGEWKSPIVKFFTDEEKAALTTKLQIEEGDLVLFAADKWEIVCEVLGRIRLRISEFQKLTEGSEVLDFLWVTDFPLMAFDAAENKWNAVHHPFTRPKTEDIPLVEAGKFGEARAEAYDVVLNGVEIGGGSIRIHEPELQAKMFAALGVNEEEQQTMFGHILRAFRLGAPPHGGIAMGLDRLVMLICGAESIREVMAFPKNNRGQDLMSQSPSDVDLKQLRELRINLQEEKTAVPPAPTA